MCFCVLIVGRRGCPSVYLCIWIHLSGWIEGRELVRRGKGRRGRKICVHQVRVCLRSDEEEAIRCACGFTLH